MLRGLTCKDECTSNLCQSREALKQNTLNFARVFCAVIKNFLASPRSSLLCHNSCQPKRKSILILSVRVATAGKRLSPESNLVIEGGASYVTNQIKPSDIQSHIRLQTGRQSVDSLGHAETVTVANKTIQNLTSGKKYGDEP